jgi:hypothetical protein
MDSKFVDYRLEENGHDCWGNLEWSKEYFVYVKGKMQRVFDDYYVRTP